MFRQGAKYIEVENGARICKLLKSYYFDELKWGSCSKKVTEMYINAMHLARKLYADLTEREVLDLLLKYDKQDFEDLLDAKANGREPNGNCGSTA